MVLTFICTHITGIKNVEVDLSNQVVRILGNSPVKVMTEALEQTGRKARLIGQGIPEGWSCKFSLVLYMTLILFFRAYLPHLFSFLLFCQWHSIACRIVFVCVIWFGTLRYKIVSVSWHSLVSKPYDLIVEKLLLCMVGSWDAEYLLA